MKPARHEAQGVLEAVALGGRIQPNTLVELQTLLRQKTTYEFWVAVEVVTGAIVKTLDNEADAQETIRRLRAAPDINQKTEGNQ